MVRLLASLIVISALLLPGSAEAAYYRGGGDGIKVEMRVRDHKIVFARVATKLYCSSGSGHKHTEPLRFYFGKDRRDATNARSGSIPIGRRGYFRDEFESPPIEEDGFEESVFRGRVGTGRVGGDFRFRAFYEEDCRTGGYQRFAYGNKRKERVHFRIRRL